MESPPSPLPAPRRAPPSLSRRKSRPSTGYPPNRHHHRQRHRELRPHGPTPTASRAPRAPEGVLRFFRDDTVVLLSEGARRARRAAAAALRAEARRRPQPRHPRGIRLEEVAPSLRIRGEEKTLALPPGTQDRLSIMYQFMNAPPGGGRVRLHMSNGRKVDLYSYRKVDEPRLSTPAGEFDTTHYERVTDSEKESHAQLWLARDRFNLPVRVVFEDANGLRRPNAREPHDALALDLLRAQPPAIRRHRRGAVSAVVHGARRLGLDADGGNVETGRSGTRPRSRGAGRRAPARAAPAPRPRARQRKSEPRPARHGLSPLGHRGGRHTPPSPSRSPRPVGSHAPAGRGPLPGSHRTARAPAFVADALPDQITIAYSLTSAYATATPSTRGSATATATRSPQRAGHGFFTLSQGRTTSGERPGHAEGLRPERFTERRGDTPKKASTSTGRRQVNSGARQQRTAPSPTQPSTALDDLPACHMPPKGRVHGASRLTQRRSTVPAAGPGPRGAGLPFGRAPTLHLHHAGRKAGGSVERLAGRGAVQLSREAALSRREEPPRRRADGHSVRGR